MTFCAHPVLRLLPLLTLLLAPRGALATPGPLEFSPLPGNAPRASLRLLQEPEHETGSKPASKYKRSPTAMRILAEVGGGLLMSFGTSVVGGVVGFLVCPEGFQLFKTTCQTEALVGYLLGAGLGTALGAYLGGKVTGGDGHFFTGALPGMAVGLATAVALSLLSKPGIELAVPLVFPLGLIGAIVGYELTDSGGPTRSIQPMLGVSSRGATLGLAGTF